MATRDPSERRSRDDLIAEVRRRAARRRLYRRGTVAAATAVVAAISVAVPVSLAGGGRPATVRVLSPPTKTTPTQPPPPSSSTSTTATPLTVPPTTQPSVGCSTNKGPYGTLTVCPGAAPVGATVTIQSDSTCATPAGSTTAMLMFLGPQADIGSGGGGNQVPNTLNSSGFRAIYRIPATYQGNDTTGNQPQPVVPGNGYSFATYPAAGCQVPFTVTRGPSSGPLGVELTASPDPVRPGSHLTYTITVTNLGTTPISNVSARLPLPQYVQWVSWSPNCQGQGPTFTCTFVSNGTYSPPGPQSRLQPGQSQSATITTTVDSSPTVPSFAAIVTASGTAPSGQVTASATHTTTES